MQKLFIVFYHLLQDPLLFNQILLKKRKTELVGTDYFDT
jgi:hypothetical protein